MKYKNNDSFSHNQRDKVGVLITNLGTPDAPTAKALKPYLKQFLSDPRVVEVPRLLWWFILNGIILNTRPKKSAHAYKTVWTEAGSPLAWHTQNQADAIRSRLAEKYDDNIVVEWAMRYGNPSIDSVIQKLLEQGVRKLLVLPLYPQYSASTTGSTFDAVSHNFQSRRWIPELRFINQYHDFAPFINVLTKSVEQHWEKFGRADKLVFSYHGVPKRYLLQGDPYHCQCHKTTRLVANKLGLTENQYITTFQSRFGKEEWLKPYTDETMRSLPKQGANRIQVICPGFSADCLETIEEIAVENKRYFLDAGGDSFEYIPCLNSSDNHIDALTTLIESQLQGWPLNTEVDLNRENRFSTHSYNKNNNS